MRKKKTTKVKPVSKRKELRQIEYEVAPFHETFPFTLSHKKDKEKKVCYFQCKEHMDSYIKKSKLSIKDIKIEDTIPRIVEDKE
jgi:hypothetical protein